MVLVALLFSLFAGIGSCEDVEPVERIVKTETYEVFDGKICIVEKTNGKTTCVRRGPELPDVSWVPDGMRVEYVGTTYIVIEDGEFSYEYVEEMEFNSKNNEY